VTAAPRPRVSPPRSAAALARAAGFCTALAGHALLVFPLSGLAATSPPTAKRPASAPRAARPAARPASPPVAGHALKPIEVALQARTLEETGAYSSALEQLKRLRGMQGPDADLELAIALDEARIGLADSAWSRLHGPLLTAALSDTGGPARRTEYPFQREGLWINGRFDGWYWYVARARAELAFARRDWKEAAAMASRAALARPLSGKEALLLALAASHTGDAELGEAAAGWAAYLEPWLPEAHYLAALWAWRHGRRGEAREWLKTAIAADSSWRVPVLALTRLTLPGSQPDSIPTRFLSGARACAMLTSSHRPKQEEYIQFDKIPSLVFNPQPQPPDSVRALLHLQKATQIYVQVLVSEKGVPLLSELPWVTEAQVPAAVVHHVLDQVGSWRFLPAVKFAKPYRTWASVEYVLKP
jgi:hypothetical protein